MRFNVYDKVNDVTWPTEEFTSRVYLMDCIGDLYVEIYLDGSFSVMEYKLIDIGLRWCCRDSEDFDLILLQ